MIYLGTLGRMIGIKCPSSQQLTSEGEPSFEYSLEGRRLAQVAPSIGRRAWQCQLSDASTPDQVGAIMAFINREWGNGPFNFVSADAPVTNMLSPAASTTDSSWIQSSVLMGGGPMLLPDGTWAGRSIVNSDPAQLLIFSPEHVPVIPGQAVTGSAFLRGAGAVARMYFYDAEGLQISNHASTVTATAATTVRSWVTATAPASAATCRVFGHSASQGARPAITWSDSMLDWADGQGCAKAVVHGPSRNLVMASRDPRGGRYSNLSFTVSEVG